MIIAYISHPDCMLHEMGDDHPEQPARLSAISDGLISSGLETALQHYDAPQASRDQLLRVHDSKHIEALYAAAPQQGLIWLDGDTAMNPHTLEAALRAAGSVCLAVDLLLENNLQRAFCAVRPPGHHAERHRAMGFCFFNNIAVGAAHALEHHGLKRVAIVDFDVHHGNGTENIFAGDERVLFCSTYQHPFYPDIGRVGQHANVIRCPLPADSDGDAFRNAVEQHWLPALEQFKPELVMISAGFDGHAEDDLANLRLRESDYQWITDELCRVADTHAQRRIISCLEGGYNLDALPNSVVAHLKALM